LADLREGEVVLDLGCGTGLDVFLAARRVGAKGRVIGVDKEPGVIEKARESAKEGHYENVEFRVAEMEHLPIGDNSIDVAISNCVINYSADKLGTFKEVRRVLRPGGRFFDADLVVVGRFSESILRDEVWGKWIAGAMGKEEYLAAIAGAGFGVVSVIGETLFPMAEADERLKGKIISLQVKGLK